MKMPANYVDLSADEMEYDGGLFFVPILFVASVAVTTVGVTSTVVGHVTDNNTLKQVGTICTIGGLALTGVGIGAAAVFGVGSSTIAGAALAFDLSLGIGFGVGGLVLMTK